MSAWLYLIQQAAGAWSLLLALGLCMGLRKAAPLRLGAASLLSGMAALLCAMYPHAIVRMAALLLLTVFAPMAAWPGVPRSQRRRMLLTCLTLSLLMAGLARLLQAAGVIRTPLILAQFALLPLLSHFLPTESRAQCITVELTHTVHRLELTALVDSGNLLRDPLTQLPVIVVSRQAAARLIPLPGPGEITPGMRLISVHTIAGTSLMPVFRPGQVRLLLPGGWLVVHAVIGLSPDGYSGFQALIPQSLIPSAQGGIALCP